ncbi:MAG: Ger(x)C family spore germination protein [Tissierellia bacterium]|nr:Ger(x)C family spore germination protein [Tissierellia bacterium]
MKNIKIIIITILTSIFLTACWDSVEINKREYIFAVGIDKNDKNLTFTAEIPKINEGSEEQRLVYTKDSANFADFYATSYLHSEKAISDRLMQVIVLGEDLARDAETVKRIFDEIQRSPQMNRRVKICIAKGKAQDIINTEIPSNPIVGRFLSEMLIKLKRENYQDVYTFDEAILNLGKTGNTMVPVVEANEKSLKIERAGVFKEYELKGFLEPDEVAAVMVVLNPDKAKIRNVNIMVEGTNVSLGVVDIIMTTDMNISGDKLTVDYYATLNSYIDSFIIGSNKLEDQSYLNKIKEEAIKSILTVSESTLDKLQQVYKTDLLKIKEDLFKYHKQDYEKISDKYDEIFEAADINIHLDMVIKSTGLVK